LRTLGASELFAARQGTCHQARTIPRLRVRAGRGGPRSVRLDEPKRDGVDEHSVVSRLRE
jgi:hypothetical protein